jgi:predicted transcriptional regulator
VATTTVRLSAQAHRRLTALANARGERLQTVLEQAIAAYEEAAFWDEFTQGYDRLAADEQSSLQLQRERDGEAPSLVDGAR